MIKGEGFRIAACWDHSKLLPETALVVKHADTQVVCAFIGKIYFRKTWSPGVSCLPCLVALNLLNSTYLDSPNTATTSNSTAVFPESRQVQ